MVLNSDAIELGPGYHIIAYEYRSGYTTDYSPTDSYAVLSWAVGGETFGAVSGANSTNVTSTVDELFADVGWLACSVGHGTIHGSSFMSGCNVDMRSTEVAQSSHQLRGHSQAS